MKRILLTAALALTLTSAFAQQTFTFGTKTTPQGRTFEVDSKGFIVDGKHVLPVMGEIHYSRVPQKDWLREIRKMKAGGITVLSTYVFWIHHEPVEGKWNWSENNDLHHFIELCKQEEMPVVLRVGPFCHGEVYQGGFPDWIVKKASTDPKNYKIRSTAPGFLAATQRLYSNIYAQVSDMLWKHGGPVVGVQIENECRGPWGYYMALKDMAVSIGFDTPFYTRTGWPKLNGKEEFGKLLPLYGDYADGFWDRSLQDMPGEYPKAFVFKDTRVSGVIATETFGTNQDTKMDKKDLQYPYLTCELGGGMMPAYHRRINMSGNEAMPLAICKLGSGSNLPGYYMYHGGTNPYNPQHTMAETQATTVTNYNDMPYMSYDFQCPLGEMGQPNINSYHQTRWLHQFLADWGEELSQMDVDTLSDNYACRGCFEFHNSYVRIIKEDGLSFVCPKGMEWEGLKITSNRVQPFAKADGELFFINVEPNQIPAKMKSYYGKPVLTINGKKYSPKLDKPFVVNGKTITILSRQKAATAFVIDGKMCYSKNNGILYKADGKVVEESWQTLPIAVAPAKIKEADAPREIRMGSQKVAAMPSNEDFNAAAVYSLDLSALPEESMDDLFLEVNYQADCARVYANGILVEDNFWNGKPMLVRCSDLKGKEIELRILPLRKDAPIYLQKAQRKILDKAQGTSLLNLESIKVIQRKID